MKVPHVLVVDDEPGMIRLISLYLQQAGYDVSTETTGNGAVRAVTRRETDLVVLDIGLPDMDGYRVCRRIREESRTPIIMLTARSEHRDRMRGFEEGADDYVPKPFHPEELVARVGAVLRRLAPDTSPDDTLTVGGLVADVGRRLVTLDGQPIGLRPKEFEVLVALMSQPGQVFTRAQLLEGIWEREDCTTEATVDVHVGRLRSKLGESGRRSRFIQTVWGVGYAFREGTDGI